MEAEPIFVVICRNEGIYVPATSSIYTDREVADHYASTIAASREPIVLQLDGLVALVFRHLCELAQREVRRENEKAEAETKGPTDSPEPEVPLARTSG